MQDRYGLELGASSAVARDAYIDGVDRMLAGGAGAGDCFEAALLADPDFALALAALARWRQFLGDGRAARRDMAAALELPEPATARERSHLQAMNLLIAGAGLAEVRAHLAEYPRDAVLAQSCTGVFGLIGFSGLPGREAEQLAFTESLARDYGDDWWFLGQHAFSQVEVGQIGAAGRNIERALAGNPMSAHNVHIRAHVDYEAGEAAAGLARLADWIPGLERDAIMYCHINWHIALWRLLDGAVDEMWRVYDADVSPDGAWGPSINVVTDCVSLLYRAQLAGAVVPAARWARVSAFASETFPHTGIAFVDVHAALAFAVNGDDAELDRVLEGARGPAADMVTALGGAFRLLARRDWSGAIDALAAIMAEHERIGGSRAQRDLIEFALIEALKQGGHAGEARRLLAMRRAIHEPGAVVAGL